MILAIVMALAAPQVATEFSDATTEAHIVIIGRRARGVRWDWRLNKAGVLTKCKITRSSGDAQIDQLGCDATRLCGAQGLRVGRAMTRCIVNRRKGLIDQLAAARAQRKDDR